MASDNLTRLIEIMATLRSPGGCPWDRQQTPNSLKPYLLEETHEALEALDGEDHQEICEELGDLLLQIVFLARIFEERGAFSFDDVAGSIAEKLVRRHPHVFADLDEEDVTALHRNWERIKSAEKGETAAAATFSRIPRTLPALARAQKVLVKAARYGLRLHPKKETAAAADVHWRHLITSLAAGEEADAEERLGRHLLAVADLCQQHHLDSESALRKETERLVKDLKDIETSLSRSGTTVNDASNEHLLRLWRSRK